MIEKVIVKGLPSYSHKTLTLEFNHDINIITGKNGQGKTTLLKLIWYVYSGNLLRAINEVQFEELTMVTDKHIIKIAEISFEKSMDLTDEFGKEEGHTGYDISIYERKKNEYIIDTFDYDAEVLNIRNCSNIVSKINKSSLYFPTFRRIEGLSSRKKIYNEALRRLEDEEQMLSNVLKRIADNHSEGEHKYITSVSTKDINELITNKYAEISEEVNLKYKKLTDDIEQIINEKDSGIEARQVSIIKELLDSNKSERDKAFQSINVINEIVSKLFERNGIKISNTISLGEQKKIIDSELLSAGEKQMLSFISYNALYVNTPIIIDEPEISLHVDWQRRLLKLLMNQNTNNQIIIATHSPFIYSKYGDKEIIKDFDTEVDRDGIENYQMEITTFEEFNKYFKGISGKGVVT